MKSSTRKGLIHFRYIAPFIVIIVMVILMNIPCYTFYYEVIENEALKEVPGPEWSLADFAGNAWNTSRYNLFVEEDPSAQLITTSKYNFGIILTAAVLFCIGVVSAVYSAVIAGMYFWGDKKSAARAMFITLIPNRVVLCIYYAMLLPIFFIPAIEPLLFNAVYDQQTRLVCAPFDMSFVALGVYALLVALIFFTAKLETVEDMNVYKGKGSSRGIKRRQETLSEDDCEDEEEELDEYEQMNRKAKEEQAARILALLNKSKQTQKEDEEDK